MRKQIYLCVDLKTYTVDTPLQQNEARKGTLSMTETGEQFFFIEDVPAPRTRNKKVYRGKRINVSFTHDGRFAVTFRKLHLTPETSPLLIADEIFVELQAAMKSLGIEAKPEFWM